MVNFSMLGLNWKEKTKDGTQEAKQHFSRCITKIIIKLLIKHVFLLEEFSSSTATSPTSPPEQKQKQSVHSLEPLYVQE